MEFLDKMTRPLPIKLLVSGDTMLISLVLKALPQEVLPLDRDPTLKALVLGSSEDYLVCDATENPFIIPYAFTYKSIRGWSSAKGQ